MRLALLAVLLAAALPAGALAQAASRATVQGLIGNAVYANQGAGKWLDGAAGADFTDPEERMRQAIARHAAAGGELRTAHALALASPGLGLGGFFNATVQAHAALNARLKAAVAAQADALGADLAARSTARLAKALDAVSDRRGRLFALP